MEALQLDVTGRAACLLEVEANLTDRHHAGVGPQVSKQTDLWRRRLCRVMADPRPHLLELTGESDGLAAALEVDTHGDHSRDTGADCRPHHLSGVAQLLEVEMSIYEDSADSSSTTSSSRLNRASGGGSARPGGS